METVQLHNNSQKSARYITCDMEPPFLRLLNCPSFSSSPPPNLQIEITMVTSVEVSSLLASLPPSTPLTLQELQTLTDIATQLVDTSGSNIQVSSLLIELSVNLHILSCYVHVCGVSSACIVYQL